MRPCPRCGSPLFWVGELDPPRWVCEFCGHEEVGGEKTEEIEEEAEIAAMEAEAEMEMREREREQEEYEAEQRARAGFPHGG